MLHRNLECIAIHFAASAKLNAIARRITGVRWSRQHTCWYLPLLPESIDLIKRAFEGMVIVDDSLLKNYLEKRSRVKETLEQEGKLKQAVVANSPAWSLSKENTEALRQLVQQLKLKSYSSSTINTYRNEFLQLLKLLKTKQVNELSVAEIKRFMVYSMEKLGISENTAHSRINALKFYFEQVLKRDKFFWEIPRPKKPMLLPKLLNEDELARLFNALTNKKHKAMLFTAYSAGLRVSEIVRLKIADIDSGRMQIRIGNAKGKKDWYVNLSPVLLDILRKYIGSYKPTPKVYLFESDQSLTAYPTRTVQEIFSKAKNTSRHIKGGRYP